MTEDERGDQEYSDPEYLVYVQLAGLPTATEEYALVLERAAEVSGDSERVAYNESFEIVALSVGLVADDLASAIERGLQRLFGLIDRAGLPQPGRVEMLASRVQGASG